MSTPLVARLMFSGLQVYPPLTPSELAAVTAGPPASIVILSAGRRIAPEFGGQFGGQTPDSVSLERLRYGAYLARLTGLPILISGGNGGERRGSSLAQILAEALWQDYGLRARWLEQKSTNTAQNAIFSAEILRDAGTNRVLLVTHAWHMKRARSAFVANGMSVIPAPTAFYRSGQEGFWRQLIPDAGTLRMSAYATHEIVGGMWYALKYGY